MPKPSSSALFGRRQSPATELSINPAVPLARLLQYATAAFQFLYPSSTRVAFFSQIRPVLVSVTVPLLLSTNLGPAVVVVVVVDAGMLVDVVEEVVVAGTVEVVVSIGVVLVVG